ncbi:eukaryotic translation initiation factor 3 subunit I-like [Choristoneura fumiferana]|uniref:eukaryotic translation initiation factor 3 subunit I-like n=1 Tax=Choristoneura fumiferana TaxID=7141 RepID=UPI003D15662F
MKPLMLQGHERAITQIKYNREGDLLFSAAKDSKPNVWWSLNGERLGTFNGHGGVVWCLDVDWQTINLITGGGDSSCRLWDLETGKNIATVKTNSSVRTCNFSYSANDAAYTTDKAMGHPCEVSAQRTWHRAYSVSSNKYNNYFYLQTGKKIHSIKEHTRQINDMQLSSDGTMFITASKDQTAKLFDTSSLELLKEYKTERPVNSAALSPILDHVVLGGGQDAMEVTTTSTRQGKFDARFFHLVFEEEFGRVKGHFGPINSLAFHPDGRSYASGGEDGYVRVQSFDQSYFDYTFDYNRD